MTGRRVGPQPAATNGPAATSGPAGAASAGAAYATASEAAAGWARTWFMDQAGRDVTVVAGQASGPVMLVEAYERLLQVALALVSARTDRGRTPLPLRLKQLGWDRSVRAWGLRLTAAGRRGRVGDAPIRFIAELATPSSLEPMMAVAAATAADRYSVAAADPRAYRRWSHLAGRNRAPLVLGAVEEARTLRAARRDASAVWQSLAQSPPRFELDGRDVTEAVLAALRPLVLRSLPWVAVERKALRHSFAQNPPGVAVVASDQHRIGRLVVEEAHALGRPVVVLQHGLPQNELGYLPVTADAVAVWSRSSRHWFKRHGTPKDRLAVLGNPRFDRLVGLDREASRRDTEAQLKLAGGPRILVPLSGGMVEVNAQLVQLAVDALARLPGGAVVIKLHPGLRRWQYVTDIVARLGPAAERVRVVHRDPTFPLLKWADATFVHRSSVGLESLVAGTPVIASAMATSITHDLPDLNLPTVDSAAALADAAMDLAGPESRARYFSDRRAALEDAAGPLDGRTCRRISDYLMEMAEGRHAAAPLP